MNKKRLAVCCAVLFTSVLAISAVRAEDVRDAQVSGTPNAAGGTSYRAKLLLGATVNLDGGASAGTIDDIIIDDTGNVEYLVVVTAERQLVAIPWAASRYDMKQRVVFVRIAPERFRQIPTFTVDRYPVFSAPAYRTRVYGYFGLTPNQRRHINERSGRVDVKAGRIDVQGRSIDDRRDDRRQPGDTTPRNDGTQPRTPAPRNDGTQPTTPAPRNDGTQPTTPAPRNDGTQPTTPAPRKDGKQPATTAPRKDTRPLPPPKESEPLPKKTQN